MTVACLETGNQRDAILTRATQPVDWNSRLAAQMVTNRPMPASAQKLPDSANATVQATDANSPPRNSPRPPKRSTSRPLTTLPRA